ncbi:MAG TPA: RuBisCO large subunit C-terminal-like domain-containing protein [bacterium]|nr:RuBisCO large subunit C-terminal-like domain-containing protein [bacterium]
MNRSDIQAFFADESTLDREAHVLLEYAFETEGDPFEAAAHLCQESSTAQWSRPGVDEDFRPRHAAKVVSLEAVEESELSAFGAQAADGGRFRRARVRIAHPHGNFGPRLPNLLTAAMGEGAFHCGGVTAIKLTDIVFPDSYLASFEGPRFGSAGLREALCVFERPIFFGVVKPNVGLDPESFASIAREAWEGGLDAAKDDEMLSDPDYSPFAERMRLVGEARRAAEDATGERKIFIANITDEVDRLVELHDIAVSNGVNAVMVNVMAVGLSGVRMLRKRSSVPVVAHFDCIAPMSRHPLYGVATTVITKLQRIAGCDAIIMPGFGARMGTPEEEVLANCAECAKPLANIAPALPVPGGSDWAGTLPLMCEKLRTHDFAMVPGRGVFGHPDGPRAGAASLRQAWEAVSRKIPLSEYAKEHPELAAAIAAFGAKEEGDSRVLRVAGMPTIRGFTGASLYFNRN